MIGVLMTTVSFRPRLLPAGLRTRQHRVNSRHGVPLWLFAALLTACSEENTAPGPAVVPSTSVAPSTQTNAVQTTTSSPVAPTGPTGSTIPTGSTGPTGPATGPVGSTTTTTTTGSSGTSNPSTTASSEPVTAPSGSETLSTGDMASGDATSLPDETSEPAPPCVPSGRAHNPMVTQIFTADPNAVVYGDKIYVYTSHDVDGQDNYDMVDYHVFSSADMVNWQDHGVIIHADSLPWATNLYAPGACTKNGKYYLYIPNGGDGIGVAVADDPGGPFVDPLGEQLVTRNFPNANVTWLFDPACFVDEDGQGYLYFGGGNDGGDNARVVRLNEDMISIKDASATTIIADGFFEASFVHKRNGVYYFSYSSDFTAEHGAALEYLTSDNPMTGFTAKGKFLPNSNINNGDNNHGSIVDFKGKWYLFYHARKLQQELGVNKVNNRSVAVQEITYATNGNINPITMSTEDFTVSQIECLDGFSEVEAETLAAEKGIEVEGRAGETVRVAQIANGDWVGYSQVNFRNGASKLVLRVASAQGGGTIDVRIDGCITGAQGTSVGSCEVVATGGGNMYADLVCAIDAPAGPHDLCLHFAGTPAFELDSWHLE